MDNYELILILESEDINANSVEPQENNTNSVESSNSDESQEKITNSLVEATEKVASSLVEVTEQFTSSLEITETISSSFERSENSENVTRSLQVSEKVINSSMQITENVPEGITVTQLRDIVHKNWSCPQDNLNEVYPGIYIGDEVAAKDIDLLKRLKMTHILNAAWSEGASFIYVNTSQGFYTLRNFECTFFGVRAVDSPTFKLARHFEESSDFIESALSSPTGRVLVHCRQGVSRSATLVIVYLMMRKNMSAKEAVSLIRKKRNIFPNQGFMKEICSLDDSLRHSRNS